MPEIGSFIEYKKDFFNADNDRFAGLIFFQSGREALRYLIGHFKIRTIFLPSYFCDDVCAYLKKIKGLKIKEYALDDKLGIKKSILAKIKSKNEGKVAFLMVDFFGRRDPNYDFIAASLKRAGVVLLSDRTHSALNSYNNFFDAELASIKKLFVNLPGAYVGGVKYTGKYARLDLQTGLALLGLKERYLKNNDKVLKKKFLEGMRKEEGSLANFHKNARVVKAPKLEEILSKADIKKMKRARMNNYITLSKNIKPTKKFAWLDLGFAKNETPTFALIKCTSYKIREGLKAHLIKNDIYPPVHWPNGTELSRLLISIPIDHRYLPKDMRYVSSVINRFNK